MQEILHVISGLTKSKLDFEQLGDVIYGLDFKDVDYEPYLPADRSKTDYCRKVLHKAPLECVLLYWPPATESAIHFHQGFWGYVAVLEGEAENIDFKHKNKELKEGTTFKVRKGGIIREPDNIIHQIKNASDSQNLVTMHFYHPPISTFKGMQIFHLETGRTGTLSDKAKSASWKQPIECFDLIEENAFKYVDITKESNAPSHRIVPIIPKPSCEVISTMLSGYYNEQAQYYDNFDTQHESRLKYTQRLNSLIVKDIKDNYSKIENKLAIACGTGRRVLDIQDRLAYRYKVVGVDISSDMCKIAEERGVQAIHDDWLEAKLPNNTLFDVTTFLYAFGHITRKDKRIRVLKKVFDHLKPGGTFYLDVFNLDDKTEWGPRALSYYNNLKLGLSGYEEGDVFYKKLEGKEIAFLHYFREREIEDLLYEVGFNSVEIIHVGYVHNPGEILEEKDRGALFIKARKSA